MGAPRGRVPQNGATLLGERSKLDQRLLDEGPRLKRGKVGASLWRGNTNDMNQEMNLRGELMF